MALTNYWMQLIWLFTGGIILANFFPRQQEIVLGKKEERWGVLPAVLLILPYIFMAAWRTDNFGDTYVYRKDFLNAPEHLNQMLQYVNDFDKDKGFHVLTALIKSIIGNSDILYFFIIAAFQLLVVALVCRRLSCNYWLSIFIFIASTDYMSWVHNGMRQFIAVTIIFAATELIIWKKYLISILLILFASTMHGSALLMLPVIFIIQGKAWNKKTIICIFVSILALVFVDQFTNILDTILVDTQYENVVSDWQAWNDNGTNPIRVLVYAVPTILGMVGYKYIKYADDPVINLGIGAGIISASLGLISMGTSGIFLGRLPIYVSM
ncbi:MAG: EpsG family protein [Lachnospiraceae bacterium]|nr:EpsG family protein [Lachnospiraceae bacterium]